jgi:hypothetical protein
LGDYGHVYTRIREARKKENVDILLLGSSHAYRGLDPRIFESYGYNLFNFGSSSQSPIQMTYIISKYFNQLNPKVVLIEVYPNTFQSDGVESALDFVANDNFSFSLIKMIFKVNKLKVYNAAIYKIFSLISGKDANFNEARIIDEDKYISGGFVERDFEIYKGRDYDKMIWNLDLKQKEEFESVISILKQKTDKIIIFEAPITHDLFKAYSNNREIDRYFKSFNLNFVNFNYDPRLQNDSIFYDHHHLNQEGVSLFNRIFIESYKMELNEIRN